MQSMVFHFDSPSKLKLQFAQGYQKSKHKKEFSTEFNNYMTYKYRK